MQFQIMVMGKINMLILSTKEYNLLNKNNSTKSKLTPY